MLFSTRAEYGVRLMVELGRQEDGAPVALSAVAESERLPLSYLEHLVAKLRKAGLVESQRGAHGGYRLGRPPGELQMLKGVSLDVDSGSIHALMGPNGSGKSTLANAIMGHPSLEVTDGTITFKGNDITEAAPDERSRMGLFMAFQYPVAIPGVTVAKYLRMAVNAHREGEGEEPVKLKDFRKQTEEAMALTNIPKDFSSRYLNDGFSGGEKKRMEILQLAMLQPDM